MRNSFFVWNSALAKSLLYFFLAFHISPLISYSQTSTSSPYSRYGLGDLQYSGFANLTAMGGVSYALSNDSLAPFYINICNPASHANYRLTAFDVGVMDQFTQLQTSSQKFNTNRAALAYIAFAFPVKKWWGGSFGMVPFSSVGYKVNTSSDLDTNLGTVHYAYQGSGGLNEVYLANSFKYRDFSLGINVSYLFGELVQQSRDSFPDVSNSFSTRVTEKRQFSDVYFKAGLQYRRKLNSNWSVALGLTANLEANLSARHTYLAETYKYRFNLDQVKDTVKYVPDVKEEVVIPGMYGFGLAFRKTDKLVITADVSTQNWSKFDSFGQGGLLGNSNRVSAGFQYWPERAALKGSYFRRVAYRAGVRFSNTMLLLNNNTPVNDMAVTFGFGMPLRITKVGENYNQAMLNLSFELGQRGTTENSLIKENYIRVVLGFSINEKWFIQRKYD